MTTDLLPDGRRVSDLPYRPGVGIMMLNRRGDVFVGRRIDATTEAWQMPQGGIDDGEDPRTAALRELMEEAGTADVDVVAELDRWITYDLPVELIPKVWRGRFRGQRQRWFAVRFRGPDSAIDIATDHAEFSAWRWVPIDELEGCIVPFKRAIYREIVNGFRHLAVPAE